jgi:Potato inhibitor I family
MKTRRFTSWAVLVTVLGVLQALETSSSIEVEIEQGIMSATSTSTSTPPSSFPRLSGMDGKEAMKLIEKEYPSLSVQLLPENSVVTMDYREDRVRIFVDKYGKVARVPIVG